MQTFEEFLMENYEMAKEEFEHADIYTRNKIQIEYDTYISDFVGKQPSFNDSEDHGNYTEDDYQNRYVPV